MLTLAATSSLVLYQVVGMALKDTEETEQENWTLKSNDKYMYVYLRVVKIQRNYFTKMLLHLFYLKS